MRFLMLATVLVSLTGATLRAGDGFTTDADGKPSRLPADLRFPEGVRKVEVRVLGPDRVISPAGSAWDSFFDTGPGATDDFMAERAGQTQAEREAL